MSATSIKRALISVSNKTGVIDFARNLHAMGVEILSTGGTAKLLNENSIPVTEVSDYTKFPEIMNGRVKTLHPKIHASLLRRDKIDDAVIAEHGVAPIDLVAVNLYPFQQVIQQENVTFTDVIENIDIGGPTMVRASAKNHAVITVVVDPNDYPQILAQLDQNSGKVSATTRFNLAKKAFAHTAQYDATIANYLSALDDEHNKLNFPDSFNSGWQKKQELRYGENSHQQAAFYVNNNIETGNIANSQQLHGKELSYNNIADADTALECVKEFSEPACVIVKHANPCGVAVANDLMTAYELAFKTDPTSAFGGIIAFNRAVDANLAQKIVAQQFVEVVIAPEFSADALAAFATKKNVRVLNCGAIPEHANNYLDYKAVNGGMLIQDHDNGQININDIKVVTKRQPTEQELKDLEFTWKVAKFVKSNAIVYAKQQATIGVGAGQMSRVYSAKIAGIKAEDEGLVVSGSVMASDAFFPFRDSVAQAAQAGITAIIQPGGSIRDEEVIQAADEANIAMLFTGMRHFRH